MIESVNLLSIYEAKEVPVLEEEHKSLGLTRA